VRRYKVPFPVLALTALAAFCGCNKTAEPPSTGSNSDDNTKYKLAAEPKDAIGVIRARKTAKDGDEVVVVGRVGGRKVPWAKGRAAFRIVDASLKSCAEVGSDDCATPWDY